jgi:acyl-[acyl-carrier-protein]-phospholipid O-acyltransferase / long-chain-fatty-acid--[acyl-carrier-protein] ligase
MNPDGRLRTHQIQNEPASYAALLQDRSFHCFLWTQFLGAFNDNVYKMIVSMGAVEFAASRVLGARYLAIAGAVFVLPFMLFAGYAGQIADRFSKTRVLQVTKAFEIAIMLAGIAALEARSVDLLLVVLFLLALQANMFSPAKYGIVPEMLDASAISRANGLLEFSTFAAIVLGSSGGTLLFARWSAAPLTMGCVLLAIAIAGSIASAFIRHIPASGSHAAFNANPFGEVRKGTQQVAGSRSLLLAIAANSYFWFAGALVQLAVILLGQETLHLSEAHTGLLVTALAAGISAGSIAAGSISGSRIELGLVPCGGLMLSVFAVLIGSVHSFALCALCLAGAGFAGGLYIVPLNAWLQEAAGPQEKGRLLATNSFWNAVGIVIASGLLWMLHDLFHWTTSAVFIGLGFLTLLVSIFAARMLAAEALRFIVGGVLKIFFRVRVVGAQNIPQSGGVLIASNHVSYADAVLIGCVSPRMIRFLMFEPLYRNRFLNPVCRLFQTIPLPQDAPRDAVTALRRARAALASGHAVGIFPEGRITRTGHVQGFERGVELIARGLGSIPVVPVYLDGLWGHTASLKDGGPFRKFPRLRYAVTIVIGEPIFGASAEEMRERVLQLGTQAAAERESAAATLGQSFVRQAKRHWSAPAIADSSERNMTYGETLVDALLLSRWIRLNIVDSRSVGLVAPASVDGAVANLGVTLAGKIAVNLNFTAGPDHIRQAIEISGITAVLASRDFAAKIDCSPVRVSIIEELLSSFTPAERLMASIAARILPARALAPVAEAAKRNDVAAIIFSSGSTGTPKGVMLSHANLITNTGAAAQIYPIREGDCILGALPFFHSFGYAYTLWFPLLNGFRAVYHANPMDAKVIGELAAKHRAAFFLSTPTFCLAYLRRCTRDQFASIRCFVVGAEKLRPSLAEAFREKFGITLLEGYGSTEMGPVVSVNVPSGEIRGAGRPLPNVSLRIVDPETFAPLKQGETGLLLANGPGRMVGYAGDPVRTRQALHGGHYITGDLAFLDEQGFLHVVDRIARFSKIAGEMVPHGKIEEALAEVAGAGRVAVTAVPDERRGERLAVLYSESHVTPEEMIGHLKSAGLPALWIPKSDAFLKVATIPMLATGKTDLRNVREMAPELVSEAVTI